MTLTLTKTSSRSIGFVLCSVVITMCLEFLTSVTDLRAGSLRADSALYTQTMEHSAPSIDAAP